MGTTTTIYSLYKPDIGETGWGALVNANCDTIDANLNVNHTGEVTGTTALTVASTAITNKPAATVASGDLVLIADISAGNALSKVTAQSIADLATGGGSALAVLDEAVSLTVAATSFNFTGTGVVATNLGNAVTVTIPGTGVASYIQAFTNANLVAGILSVAHSIGTKYVMVQVFDNNDLQVSPDDVTLVDANNLTLNLTSFGVIAGTWRILVLSTGALVSSPSIINVLAFTNADLVAGVLTHTHNLSQQYPLVQIYNNSNKLMAPDDVTATSSSISTIDLSSFGVITGTWRSVVHN